MVPSALSSPTSRLSPNPAGPGTALPDNHKQGVIMSAGERLIFMSGLVLLVLWIIGLCF